MKYIEAIENLGQNFEHPIIFLAGGITGCPDWQREVINVLESHSKGTILNPRRKNFPIEDPNAAKKQITWEYNALRRADAILFWFPKETICPIVLFELGAHAERPNSIFVGVHPEYQRKQDVEIQMELRRPNVNIHKNLEHLVAEIGWFITDWKC